MREFKSSQLLELRRMSKKLYEAFDYAAKTRAKLVENLSTSQYEYEISHSLEDPEFYYHFKLFDKGVSIVRLYNKSDWNRKDDVDGFHFAIRCYSFNPMFRMYHFQYGDNVTFGDFSTIGECIKYFIAAIIKLTDTQYNVFNPSLFMEYELNI